MIARPEFIIFDYGNTLVHEDVDMSDQAFEGVYKNITTNPRDLSLEEMYSAFKALRREISDSHHPADLEYRYTDLFKILFNRLGLRSDRSLHQLSEIYFDDYAPAAPMAGAVEVLDYLESEGIPTGVISNLSFSQDILARRMERVLDHQFEFVITTAEWIYRKPDTRIFDIGINMADAKRSEIWYVGDNPKCDIYGADRAGIVPVYYDSDHYNPFIYSREQIELDMDHIHIDHMAELIDIIEKAK